MGIIFDRPAYDEIEEVERVEIERVEVERVEVVKFDPKNFTINKDPEILQKFIDEVDSFNELYQTCQLRQQIINSGYPSYEGRHILVKTRIKDFDFGKFIRSDKEYGLWDNYTFILALEDVIKIETIKDQCQFVTIKIDQLKQLEQYMYKLLNTQFESLTTLRAIMDVETESMNNISDDTFQNLSYES